MWIRLLRDCKSGVSGARAQSEVGTLFAEASDSLKAYGVAGHRHTPETVAQLNQFAGCVREFDFYTASHTDDSECIRLCMRG